MDVLTCAYTLGGNRPILAVLLLLLATLLFETGSLTKPEFCCIG